MCETTRKVKELDKFTLNNKKIIEDIDNKKAYKKTLNSQSKQFEEIKKLIIQDAKKVKIVTKKSKYAPFTEAKRYTQFTGIDYRFFNNII